MKYFQQKRWSWPASIVMWSLLIYHFLIALLAILALLLGMSPHPLNNDWIITLIFQFISFVFMLFFTIKTRGRSPLATAYAFIFLGSLIKIVWDIYHLRWLPICAAFCVVLGCGWLIVNLFASEKLFDLFLLSDPEQNE